MHGWIPRQPHLCVTIVEAGYESSEAGNPLGARHPRKSCVQREHVAIEPTSEVGVLQLGMPCSQRVSQDAEILPPFRQTLLRVG
ncbi:MAG: hypothetical protein ABI910_07560 [Gemmatimonadota bacterium]